MASIIDSGPEINQSSPGIDLEPKPEVDLVRKSQAGDRNAFAALYDLYADNVYRHVLYRVGNVADSEDLTQQTFMKAWQAIGRFQITEVPFLGWLFTIANNSVVSYYRAKRDHKVLDDRLVRIDERADPYTAAERRYHQAAIRRAMSTLKAEQQQVVALRYLEDLPYADIARVLGKTEVNVRVILHRALRQMRGSLADV